MNTAKLIYYSYGSDSGVLSGIWFSSPQFARQVVDAKELPSDLVDMLGPLSGRALSFISRHQEIKDAGAGVIIIGKENFTGGAYLMAPGAQSLDETISSTIQQDYEIYSIQGVDVIRQVKKTIRKTVKKENIQTNLVVKEINCQLCGNLYKENEICIDNHDPIVFFNPDRTYCTTSKKAANLLRAAGYSISFSNYVYSVSEHPVNGNTLLSFLSFSFLGRNPVKTEPLSIISDAIKLFEIFIRLLDSSAEVSMDFFEKIVDSIYVVMKDVCEIYRDCFRYLDFVIGGEKECFGKISSALKEREIYLRLLDFETAINAARLQGARGFNDFPKEMQAAIMEFLQVVADILSVDIRQEPMRHTGRGDVYYAVFNGICDALVKGDIPNIKKIVDDLINPSRGWQENISDACILLYRVDFPALRTRLSSAYAQVKSLIDQ